jgi:hypothetical protein
MKTKNSSNIASLDGNFKPATVDGREVVGTTRCAAARSR